MFEPTSRHYDLPVATHVTHDGREIAYKRRRFLPRAEDMTILVDVTFVQGDRLDLIAARLLGDPEQFWRLCDANDAMNPADLTAEPGAVIRVAAPQLGGR